MWVLGGGVADADESVTALIAPKPRLPRGWSHRGRWATSIEVTNAVGRADAEAAVKLGPKGQRLTISKATRVVRSV